MKRMILFKGISQYGVSRKLADYIEEGFKECGLETELIDYL